LSRVNIRISGLFAPWWLATSCAFWSLASAAAAAQGVDVTTYHNDALRTGWNSAEISLTSNVVAEGNFGLLQRVALDGVVDAQPLVVSGLTIGGVAHDVVYVVTEANTVYAIDPSSGTILGQTHLGTPAPPAACNKGEPIGIMSTPVVDLVSRTLHVIAHVSVDGTTAFYLHALELTTLANKVPPTVVSTSRTLSNDKTVYSFSAGENVQRAALLESGDHIYGAFAGACENISTGARGWLLGWEASTLVPLDKQALTNRVLPEHSPNNFFLTSIWMSGYGPAASTDGDVFFVTGNSDPSGTTYDNKDAINLSESVVRWSPTLGKVISYFSPTDRGADVATLDRSDLDFGAGGVMLVPRQAGSIPQLAVAAGKVGILYLMNQDKLGGEDSGKVLGEYAAGACWCGPSYFEGPDGVGRVVSSGGSSINVWKVQSSPTAALVPDPGFTSPMISTGQKPGFFTSISSNGNTAGSAVVWAVNRPLDTTSDVTLYAFDAATGAQLYSATAGIWPIKRNANIVPTVANGQVYVASYRTLSIFGIKTSGQSLIARSRSLRTDAVVSRAVRTSHSTTSSTTGLPTENDH
jgi:outer membrane protein assembly factor BamB